MLVGRLASEHLREVDSDTELRHEEMKPFIDKRECKERERDRERLHSFYMTID